jgi:hypothetical protein
MNGLDKFDSRTCGILDRAIIEALTDLSKKYNVEFSTGSGRYDDLQYTVRLQVSLISETGISGDKLTWDKYAALYGLEKEDFGKTFNAGTARTFKIVGVHPRRTKRPIVGEDILTKKRFVFEPHTVSFHLKKPGGANAGNQGPSY